MRNLVFCSYKYRFLPIAIFFFYSSIMQATAATLCVDVLPKNDRFCVEQKFTEKPVKYVPILLSDIIVFIIVESSLLVPDPGKNAHNTVEGIDSDNDGVRDDVQRLIDMKYWDDPVSTHILRIQAKAYQKMITNSTNKSLANREMDAVIKAARCYQHMSPDMASQSEREIEAVLLNTIDRLQAWNAVQGKLVGNLYNAVSPRKYNTQCLGLGN